MEKIFEKTVVLKSFTSDLSGIEVQTSIELLNRDRIGTVEEAETLKEWLCNGTSLKLTLTKK